VALFLFAADLALDVSANSGRLREIFAARIARAFGREVEARAFEVELLGGPAITAREIIVGEDPRFGAEHFLRAESATAQLRWGALLRGRLEIGAVALARPSLNLVRRADGAWNFESWLARPPAAASQGLPPAGRFPERIEIDAGRVNLKRGVEKHSFALVNLDGVFYRAEGGRWQLELESSLIRPPANLQEPGIVRVRGAIGGPAANFSPLDLQLAWTEASLPDALRAAIGRDLGMRGELSLEATLRSAPAAGAAEKTPAPHDASAAPSPFRFAADLRLRGIHGWNLPPRPGDPDVNLSVAGTWRPERSRIEVTRVQLEAPRSSLRGSGFVEWGRTSSSQLKLVSTGIALADLFAWLRSFRPGVSDRVRVEGFAGLTAELSGWPPQVEQAVLATDGAEFRIPGLSGVARLGAATLRLRGRRLELLPAQVTIAPDRPAGVPSLRDLERRTDLRIRGAATLSGHAPFAFQLSGATPAARDLAAAASAMGISSSHGWAFDGGARLELAWAGTLRPFAAALSGTAQARDLRLQPPFLNLPVVLRDARFEWSAAPGAARAGKPSRRVTLWNAEAFGARWQGTLASDGGEPWQFALKADSLSAATLDRWLNPRWRQSLLERAVAGFAFSRDRNVAATDAAVSGLAARGRLEAGSFLLGAAPLRRLRADMRLEARRLALEKAQADFAGGQLTATLEADLAPEPSYRAGMAVENAGVAEIVDLVPSWRGRLSGKLKGTAVFTARGASRDALLGSASADGSFDSSALVLRGIDVGGSIAAETPKRGATSLTFTSGSFQVRNSVAYFTADSVLAPQVSARTAFHLRGRIELPDRVDVVLEPAAGSARGEGRPAAEAAPAPVAFRLAGSAEALLLVKFSDPRDALDERYSGRAPAKAAEPTRAGAKTGKSAPPP
jgi:hypothetical protein